VKGCWQVQWEGSDVHFHEVPADDRRQTLFDTIEESGGFRPVPH